MRAREREREGDEQAELVTSGEQQEGDTVRRQPVSHLGEIKEGPPKRPKAGAVAYLSTFDFG
jgi:hypothetical protein